MPALHYSYSKSSNITGFLSKVTTLLLSIEGTTTVPVTIVEEAPETTGLYLNT